MVGGKVIGLARKADSTLVHVQDEKYENDRCSIRVKEVRRDNGQPVTIQVGDDIWWQDRDAMWTPRGVDVDPGVGCGVDWDIHLPRIGYSG